MMLTAQIGGSTADVELANIEHCKIHVDAIPHAEMADRIEKCRAVMRELDVSHLILVPGSNLEYYTGVHWHPSERLLCALITASGPLHWIAPSFEIPRLKTMLHSPGVIHGWDEEKDPFKLTAKLIDSPSSARKSILLDETATFAFSSRFQTSMSDLEIRPATPATAAIRAIKSETEIAILSAVMRMTLEVQRRTARILREGISAAEVTAFIDMAHRRLVGSPSTFCIVSFGDQTAFPHGGASEQILQHNDMVLIDTGTDLFGYKSDITRSYVFGRPNDKQRMIWNIERAAQQAAFRAAQIGHPCEEPDHAARAVLAEQGLGPDYQIPGLPHRTGHGVGMDLHEHPYIVRGNKELLKPGMCFSNEPMICLYGQFGVRLEDHVYMTETGPAWFTEPAQSIERPFTS